jgi:hypothetical protein
MKPIYYSQYDPKWALLPYTIDGDKDETIKKSGCGPTCMAMVLATWVDSKITPVDTCKMAIDMKDRTADNGTEWEFYTHIDEKYPQIECKQTGSIEVALEAIKNSALVICSMKNWFSPGNGHFVLLWDAALRIHDPASKTNSAKIFSKSEFNAKLKQCFIFTKKEVKPVNLNEAIDFWKLKGVIGSPEDMKKEFKDGKLTPSRMEAFLIKSAEYVKGVK